MRGHGGRDEHGAGSSVGHGGDDDDEEHDEYADGQSLSYDVGNSQQCFD